MKDSRATAVQKIAVEFLIVAAVNKRLFSFAS